MRRPTLKEVGKYVADNGFTLLSTEYKDSRTPLLMRCPKGHTVKVTFDNFKRKGTRCRVCSGKAKHTYKYVKETIEGAGYQLISKKYVNSATKLTVECPEGHRYAVSFAAFKSGTRCMKCAVEERAKARRLDPDYVRELIESEGFTVLTEYFNARTKMSLKCPKGHSFEMTYNNWQGGMRCPRCKASKGEALIRNILSRILPKEAKFIEQYRVEIKGHNRYYDFYVNINDHPVLIEYDGAQHFISIEFFGGDETLAKNKRIDADKNEWARLNGYELWRFNYTQTPEEIEYQLTQKINALIKRASYKQTAS